MSSLTISIFQNKIFFEIIKEMKLFSKFKIKHYEDICICKKNAELKNELVVFFGYLSSEIKEVNFPFIMVDNNKIKPKISNQLQEHLKLPFSILDFEKKIVSLKAKTEFKKNSLIHLNGYIIDKNERKIKKNNLDLQLSEKEIDFLILFTENKKPIKRNFFLKNVWNYSEKSETHTVETHIHRLRKKILEKFGDKNFIKNNDKGYYI